ncbi:MAG: HAMP domain-containing sensor histidine kinase [Bacteroidota bacterium]
MSFNRYDLLILLRVVVMFSLLAAASATYFLTDYIVTPIMFAVLALVTTLELIWSLKRMERAWSRFLISMAHHDFNRSYREFGEFPELREAFELITRSFEELNTQIEADYQLLKTVNRHVKIGLVCFKSDGKVMTANPSLLELLELSHLTDINELADRFPKLHGTLTSGNDLKGEVITDEGLEKLLVRTEPFALKGESYRLGSVYNLTSTLEINELESYQKLLRVLTHEIMNSSAPILSLIQVVNQRLISGEQLNVLNDKDQRNVAISLKGIEDRTSGMLSFVNAYRTVNRDVSPNKTNLKASDFLFSLEGQLEGFKKKYPSARISLIDNCHCGISLDPDLISQVLINLVKNGLEACSGQKQPEITVSFGSKDDQLIITVVDNGAGLKEGTEGDIFIPFYTTKAKGSGIGLALSKKIVRAHQGQLTYGREGNKTRFEIRLSGALPRESTS